jgi:hypothetical protein
MKENTKKIEEVIRLSKDKWRYIEKADIEKLHDIYHEKSISVHMGGAYTKKEELDIIGSGAVIYKQVDVLESNAQIIGSTAILVQKIRIVACAGKDTYINLFSVTEVYINEQNKWKMASVSFTWIDSE